MTFLDVVKLVVLGYLAGSVLMAVSYCIGWVWSATLSVVESWAIKEPITADDLSMDLRQMGPPLWVMPAISPLIVGVFSFFLLCGTIYVFCLVVKHKVFPIFKNLTVGKINLPSWCSLDRLATSLNKITGIHNEPK